MDPLVTEVETFAHRYALTPREREILYLVITGVGSAARLARTLGLSHNTINNHFKNLYRRTRTGSRPELLSRFICETLGEAGAAGDRDAPRPSPGMLDRMSGPGPEAREGGFHRHEPVLSPAFALARAAAAKG